MLDYDALSGLDTFSIEFLLDGIDISQTANIISTGPAYQFMPPNDLANGLHLIVIKAADLAGNSASAECLLTVVETDTTPPVIVKATPGKGGYLSAVNSYLTLDYFDELSGVDPASVFLSIDNVAFDMGASFNMT